MSNVIVTTEAAAGSITAYARQGVREHTAVGSCAELVARIAGAALLGLGIVDVTVACLAPNTWRVVARHGAYIQEANK